MGKSVYLALPGHTSMAEGHCLIVPMNHYKAGITNFLIHSKVDFKKRYWYNKECVEVNVGRLG
jgi:hypothetical protein